MVHNFIEGAKISHTKRIFSTIHSSLIIVIIILILGKLSEGTACLKVLYVYSHGKIESIDLHITSPTSHAGYLLCVITLSLL